MDQPNLLMLDCLPLEILAHIVSYLGTQDLLQCSAVSLNWRKTFNNNIFWKKHVHKNLKFLEYLKTDVEPSFVSPKLDTLETLCKWRVHFMHQNHLLKNWRRGKYTRQEIEFDCDDTIGYNIQVECFDENFVFLHTTYQTEVWNVDNVPFLYKTVEFYLKELWEKNMYKIVGKKLVVVQCNVMQVFDINLPSGSVTFEYIRFFNQPEEFSKHIMATTNVDDLFQKTSYNIGEDVECHIVGNYFIGIVKTEEALRNPTMHIWDITTGNKVKEEPGPRGLSNVSNFFVLCSSEDGNTIIVCAEVSRSDDDIDSHIYGYSLFQGVYTAFAPGMLPGRNYQGILTNNCLLLLHVNVFSYDISTSTKLGEWNLGVCASFNSLQRIGKYLLLLYSTASTCRRTIFLMNLENQYIEVNNPYLSENDTGFKIGNIDVVCDKFVIICNDRDQVKEVWDFKTRSKLFEFPDEIGTFAALSDGCSKLIIEKCNKLIVLNFV